MNDVPGALGLTPDQTVSVLRTAGLAPSLHNTQPWLFRLGPDVIELHADPSRRLPTTDPQDRELRIACGAALFNLRLALQGHGIRPIVTVFPDGGQSDLVAAVRRGGKRPLTPEIERLLRAVPRRHTNRMPFSEVPVTTPEQQELRRAATLEGAWLHLVLDRGQRTTLSRLAQQAHRTQMGDPAFRGELAEWTAVGDDRPDGVPADAGGLLPAPHDIWVVRDFTGGTGRERIPGKNFEDEPLIGVLVAHHGGPAADVQAGQALQRVLLTATADGLAVSYLSQLVEVPAAREEMRRLIGAARPPQLVLRLGRGSPVRATPRRPVADLLMSIQPGDEHSSPTTPVEA